MHNRFFCILLLFVLVSPVLKAAERSKDSLWNFASPAADVILYFNTKQPEKAMDKNLWRLIQRDKQRAIASDPEEQLFDTKNRDIEVIANLHILSLSPFSAMIEGVANITGNINNDIQKLLGTLNKNGGPAPKVNEIDKIPRYNFAMPGSGNMPPVDIMFTPVNNNQLHFRINLVPQGGMSQNIIGSSQQNVKILETVPAQEQAFVFAGNVEKFAALPVWQGAQGQNVQSYLSQIKSLCVYGNVQARYLIINADIILKDPASAGKIIQLIEGFKHTLAKTAQFDIPPRIVSKGKFINVNGRVNIAKAWLMISRMTSQPRIKNSPARK